MSGGFVALQGRMNGGLAERVGSAPLTALYSFGSGLVILTIIMFFTKQMLDGVKRLPVSVRVGQLSKWQLLVGLVGAAFVWTQATVVPEIGVAAFLVGVTAGISVGSLFFDRMGLSALGAQAITWQRVAAAVIAVVAVWFSVAGFQSGWAGVGMASGLAVLVGSLSAGQQGVNSQIGKVVASPLAATWLNFVVGTLGLIALLGLVGVFVGGGSADDAARVGAAGGGAGGGAAGDADVALSSWGANDFWLLFGGVAGVGFIVTSIVSVRRLGVLVFSLFLIVGQMLVALALDLVAPTADSVVSGYLIFGVALTLFAATIAPPRTCRTHPPHPGAPHT
jgi:transporter family-2 protein